MVKLPIEYKRVGSTCERCGGIQPEAGEVKYYPEKDLLLCQNCGDKETKEQNAECQICKKPVGVQNLSAYKDKQMCVSCVKIQSDKDKKREKRKKTFLDNKMVWIGIAALIIAIVFGVLNLN